jgi:hypothetical protein
VDDDDDDDDDDDEDDDEEACDTDMTKCPPRIRSRPTRLTRSCIPNRYLTERVVVKQRVDRHSTTKVASVTAIGTSAVPAGGEGEGDKGETKTVEVRLLTFRDDRGERLRAQIVFSKG